MGKPRLILVVRHGQSEGNKNREIHQNVPDHRIKLTPEGWNQAYDAGRRLRSMLRADDTLRFFTSPYRRTRETTQGILASLTADDDDGPSPFCREEIRVLEEPRLREQDFGNFQPCSAEMERIWNERADYGHFFYRIPNGESAADAYDRISGFNESLWRQFEEEDFSSVCVLVTHGLMSRIFLMKWYYFSVEYFEDLRNVNHCELLVMRRDGCTGKYVLQNDLRTWSELKQQRALQRERSGSKKGGDKTGASQARATVVSRRWGGCPNGCNHGKPFDVRPEIAELVRRSDELSLMASGMSVPESPATRSDDAAPPDPGPSGTRPDTEPERHGPSPPGAASLHRRAPARRIRSFISDVGRENADTDGDLDSSEPEDVSPPRRSALRMQVRGSPGREASSSPDVSLRVPPSNVGPVGCLSSRIRAGNPKPGAGPSTRVSLQSRSSRESCESSSVICRRGRDFGGTLSGGTSRAADSSGGEEEHTAAALHPGASRGSSRSPRRPYPGTAGTAAETGVAKEEAPVEDVGSQCDKVAKEIEKHGRSFRECVY